MAILTPQQNSRVFGGSLLSVTLTAADVAGDSFANDGQTTLLVINGSGSSITITIAGAIDHMTGRVYADETHIVTAGAAADVGPFQPSLYNDSAGRVSLTYSAVTSLTIGVIRRAGSPVSANGRRFTVGPFIPSLPWKLISRSGQSLDVGAGTTAETLSQPYSNLMPATDNSSLIPLVEGSPYNDVERGKAVQGNQYRRLLGSGVVMVTSNGGGGLTLAELSQGTTLYDADIAQLSACNTLTLAAGETFQALGMSFTHGETDQTNSNTGYGAALATFQSDREGDVNTALGTTGEVPLLITQVSSYPIITGGTNMPIQQYNIANATAGIYLAGPKYQYTYLDGLHMDTVSNRTAGAKNAEVMYRIQENSEDWQPLQPVSATINGDVIDLTMNVPDPPMVLDTDWVLEVQEGNFGFEVYDSTNSALAIQAVTIESSTIIRIHTNGAGGGPALTTDIRYAWRSGGNQIAGRLNLTAPRGNLRDSDPVVFESSPTTTETTYNWAVHFDHTVDSIASGTTPAPPTAPTSVATHSIAFAAAKYASIPVASSISGAAATMAFWWRANSTLGGVNFVEQRGGTGSVFSVRTASGEYRVLVGENTSAFGTDGTPVTNANLDEWVGVCIAYNGTSGRIELWTNTRGIITKRPMQPDSGATALPATIGTSATLYWMGSPNGVNQGPDADMTHYATWSAAATETQIREILAAPVDYTAVDLGTPDIYYPLDASTDLVSSGGIINAGSDSTAGDATGSASLLVGDLLAEAP